MLENKYFFTFLSFSYKLIDILTFLFQELGWIILKETELLLLHWMKIISSESTFEMSMSNCGFWFYIVCLKAERIKVTPKIILEWCFVCVFFFFNENNVINLVNNCLFIETSRMSYLWVNCVLFFFKIHFHLQF